MSYASLEQIAVALVLIRDFGASVTNAMAIAASVIDGSGQYRVGAIGALQIDLHAVRSSLHHSIALALEEVPTPRRGRPLRGPKDKRGASE